MRNTDTAFFREIDKNEKEIFEDNGNIQYLNSSLCRNFDYLPHLDNTLGCSDDFYRILRQTVKKIDDPPLVMIIIFYLFAITFFSVFVVTDTLRLELLGFILFSILLFGIATALLTWRIVKKNRILKCIKQRDNVYAVSIKINGTRSFYDDSDDSPVTLHYIYSEPNLIRVPKKIFDAAAPNKRLIGAVIDTGKQKIFCALYID